MVRPDGRPAQRWADRWRLLPLLACALTVGLATGVAAVPGWAATGAPVSRTGETGPDRTGKSGPDSPPGEPTGDPTEPTTPPATVEPPGETSPPPSPSIPAPSGTTRVPTPGSPPRATSTPRPTSVPPSPRPTPTSTPTSVSTGAPSRPAGVQVDSGGITLRADEVAIDADGGSAGLTVSLGNSGRGAAQGRVEVELPTGITVPVPPSGCVTATATRTHCELGPVPAGRTAELRLPIAATPRAPRSGPLAGVVIGHLDARDGPSRRVRLNFRIMAAPEEPAVVPPPGPVAAPSAPPAAAADGGMTSTTRTAVSLIALPVLLALGLVTMSLRRRMAVPHAGTGSTPSQRTGAGAPPGTGSGPETEGGIWFRAQRPARRRGGDLDYGGPGESTQGHA